MQRITRLAAVALATLLFAGPAFAQQYLDATVYRTTPNGIYVQTRNGVTYVPNTSADWRSGNTVVTTRQLKTGKPYRVRYTNDYKPTYYPQQYVQQHKDWDWNRYQQGWQKERTVWVQDSNGNWRKR